MTRTATFGSLLSALGALFLFSGLPVALTAQQPSGAGTQSGLTPAGAPGLTSTPVVEAALPPKTTLADFAWLAGRWQGTWGPRIAQQIWTAPKAGVMMGTFQLTENDSTLVLELFTLVEQPTRIQLRLRHFTPSLVPWETSASVVLDLQSADAKTIVFENTIDGQPKRDVITRVDADTYISRSEIVPDKGEMQVTEITYHRQKEVPPPHHR